MQLVLKLALSVPRHNRVLVSWASSLPFSAYVYVCAYIIEKTRPKMSFSFVTYVGITLNSWDIKTSPVLIRSKLHFSQIQRNPKPEKKPVTITHVKITRYTHDLEGSFWVSKDRRILDLMIMSEDSPSQRLVTENQEGQHDGGNGEGTPLIVKRSLGVPGAIALLVGTIIGSGIFATPKWVLFFTGSVGMSLVVWTMCGIFALLGALCYSELGTLIPKSGGEFQYLLEAYGSLPAFLFSWTFVLFTMPATQIMVLLVFGSYVVEAIFPGSQGGRENLGSANKILAAAAMGKLKVLFYFYTV